MKGPLKTSVIRPHDSSVRRMIMVQNTKTYRLGALLGLFGCVVLGVTMLGCQQPIDVDKNPDTGSPSYASGGVEPLWVEQGPCCKYGSDPGMDYQEQQGYRSVWAWKSWSYY
jgi:hypothetical protein